MAALGYLGANHYEVGWPACGEIDIMEHWGHDPTVVAGSIHTPMSHGDTWTNGHTNVSDYNEEFHIYSIDWDENRIQFFVDDVLYIHMHLHQKILKIGLLIKRCFLF